MPRSRNECEDISDQRAKERNLGGILAQQFFRPLHHQVQSAGIPAARKGYGGKQGGMLLPDIPPQSPSLLFGLHFLVDMNRSGKEEIQQHPGDGGKPDAAEAGTDNNCN